MPWSDLDIERMQLNQDKSETEEKLTPEDYARWLRWKGYGDLVDMLGYGTEPQLCGAHKSGYYCPREPRHEGKHTWAKVPDEEKVSA